MLLNRTEPRYTREAAKLLWPVWYKFGYLRVGPNTAGYGSERYMAIENGIVNRELERYMSP